MEEAMAMEGKPSPQKGCFSRSGASGVQNWRLGWLGPTADLESWLLGSCLKPVSLCRDQGHHSQHLKPFFHIL